VRRFANDIAMRVVDITPPVAAVLATHGVSHAYQTMS
jgi:hypothetical protein